MEIDQETNEYARMNSSYSVADEPVARPPMILSWGRSDTNTLLKSEGDITVDGMNSLTFAPRRAILQISSNSYHVAAVTSTGELYTCGSNAEGQVQPFFTPDSKDEEGRPRIVEETGNHRVCAVACGLYHTVCLTASGLALSFGGNEAGQLGHSSGKITRCGPKVVEFKTKSKGPLVIKQVACGDLFTAFLTTSGEVFCCGIGAHVGNSGQGNNAGVVQAECVEGLVGTNIVWITAGSSHTIAVAATGEVFTWGDGRMGQLGLGDELFKLEDTHVQTPRKVTLPSDVGRVVGAAAGLSHSLLWTDTGALLGTGSNKYGQLGCMVPRATSFEVLNGPSGSDGRRLHCTMAACGTNHSIVLWSSVVGYDPAAATVAAVSKEYPSMRVTGFGSNNFGQVTGSSSASMFRSPEDITDLIRRRGAGRFLYISAGGDQSFLISTRSEDDSDEKINGMALFQKQFSTQMSRAPVPLSTPALLRVLTEAHEAVKNLSETDARHMRELSAALTTSCELFSSPSLLSASFVDLNQPLHLDVAGIESIYVTLMQLGRTAVTRLVASLQQAIAGLETIGASSLTASTGTGKTAAVGGGPAVRLSDGALRVLLIIWQCPCNATALLSADIFGRLIKIISNIPSDQKADLRGALAKLYPPHLFASRLIKPLHEHLILQVQSPTGLAPLFCEAFRWLHDLNLTERIVPAAVFYNSALSDLSDSILLKDYVEWKTYSLAIAAHQKQLNPPPLPAEVPFFISSFSFLLSAEAKKRILLAESAIQQQAAQHQAIVAGLSQGFFIPFFVVRIERENLLRQTLQHIVSASDAELRKPLRVVFENEEGIDEGGVRKEFFQLLITQLMSVQYGMFSLTADGRALWINQCCLWNADEYRLVGVLLGLAVYNGVLLDVHFPKVMYKKLLRQDKFELDDLFHVDPAMHDGLKKLLEYSPAEEVEYVFCRTFEVEWEEFGARRTHELIPGGKDIAVTHLNRHEYVEKLVHWLLVGSIDIQFQELYAGFSRVISPGSTGTFSSDELELLMVGTPHLDFKELEAHTTYIGDDRWGAQNPVVAAFWGVVHSLSLEDKQRLLLFATGSNKAPIGGLKNLAFKLQRMGPDSISLPTSHTCFNTLLLPEYSSEGKLRERLTTAIRECEGFGLK